MNLISLSLFGADQKYCKGALRVIDDAKRHYPGFTVRLYVDLSVPPEVIESAIAAGGQVRMVAAESGYAGTFWRFEALGDPDVDVVLLRDADSRLTAREVAAVQAWLLSDKHFHIMRDHPRHVALILAGMWGARAGSGAWIAAAARDFSDRAALGADQAFLRSIVYPRIKRDALIHDSVFSVECKRQRFPSARIDGEYVGEVVEADGSTDPALRALCARANSSVAYRMKVDLAWHVRRLARRALVWRSR